MAEKIEFTLNELLEIKASLEFQLSIINKKLIPKQKAAEDARAKRKAHLNAISAAVVAKRNARFFKDKT
jgi:hypothetical protein